MKVQIIKVLPLISWGKHLWCIIRHFSSIMLTSYPVFSLFVTTTKSSRNLNHKILQGCRTVIDYFFYRHMPAWGNRRKRQNASLWSFLFLLPLFVLPCSLFQSLSTTVTQRLWDTGCVCGGQMGKERTWLRMWREQRRPEKPQSRAWIPGPNTRFRSKPTTPLDQDRGATLSMHALQNLVHTQWVPSEISSWTSVR